MKAKIYTRNGDGGKTGLIGGEKVWKNDPRVGAYGSLDELNSLLGLLASVPDLTKQEINAVQVIQKDLMGISAYLADASKNKKISLKARLNRLEKWADNLEKELPKLKNFILPGGTPSASLAHVIRAVCRRSERDLVDLYVSEKFNEDILAYVNRLSDVLFLLARKVNYRNGNKDILWE